MATQFTKIKDLVGGAKAGKPTNKTSIFEEAGLANTQQQAEPIAPLSKTTTSGDIGASPGTGFGDTTQDQGQDQGQSRRDQSAIFQANVGKTEAPRAVEGIQGQVQANLQALQDQANAYTQNYQDQYQFNLSQDQLREAIEGDYGSEAYRTADQLMTTPDPNRLADLRGLDALGGFEGAEDYRVSDVDYLQNDAGLGYLAGRGRGPQYTQGMGALDVMLMKRDPNFNQLINQIRGQGAELERQIDTRPGELEAAAYDYGTGQIEGAQEAAREYLGDYDTSLRAQNEAEADAWEAAIQNLDREAIGKELVGDVEGDLREFRYGEDTYRPERYDRFIKGAVTDLAPDDLQDYIRYNEGDYDYSDFLTAGEASELSNLGGLLGTNRTYTESLGPGEQYGTDEAGLYKRLLGQVETGRRTEDILQEERQDEIFRAARDRAEAADVQLQADKDQYEIDKQAAAKQIADLQGLKWGIHAPEGGLDYDLAGYGTGQRFNPDIYGSPTGSYHTREDMLTQADVDALAAIQADLGASRDFRVGRGQRAGPEVDRERLERHILAPYSAEQAAYEAEQAEIARILEESGGNPLIGGLGNIDIGNFDFNIGGGVGIGGWGSGWGGGGSSSGSIY